MTSIEEMPRSGYLLLTIYFSEYGDNFQNDTRRKMKNVIPNLIKKPNKGIKLEPIDFSLIRGVIEVKGVRGGTRARGGQYLYRYETSDLGQLKELLSKISDYCKKDKMWKRFDIYFVDKIWGI
jgi:hypothetical protein